MRRRMEDMKPGAGTQVFGSSKHSAGVLKAESHANDPPFPSRPWLYFPNLDPTESLVPLPSSAGRHPTCDFKYP